MELVRSLGVQREAAEIQKGNIDLKLIFSLMLSLQPVSSEIWPESINKVTLDSSRQTGRLNNLAPF